MDDDWAFFLAPFIDEREIEAFWEVEVALDGSELPFAPDSVFENEVEFRPVKCRLALDSAIIETVFFRCLFESVFCDLPDLVAAERLALVFAAYRERDPVAVHHSECRVEFLDDADDSRNFLFDLRGATEEDRKSTRLNSSHSQISYSVFCL